MPGLTQKLMQDWGPRVARYLAQVVRRIPFSLEVNVIRDSVRYRLDLHEHAQRIMYLNLFERRLRRKMMKLLPRGGCVVDIGANVGFWAVQSAMALGPTGQVYAFEPNPWALERLLGNIHLNDKRHALSPIEVIGSALGDREGVVELMSADLAANASQASLYPPDDAAAENVQKISVPITRLDKVVKRHVHLLKIDVEGHELAVLDGGSELFAQSPPDYLVIEIHKGNLARAGQSAEALEARIRELGYQLLPDSTDIFDTMAWKHRRVS